MIHPCVECWLEHVVWQETLFSSVKCRINYDCDPQKNVYSNKCVGLFKNVFVCIILSVTLNVGNIM